ncbi:MAG: aminopeptidase [bacterium]
MTFSEQLKNYAEVIVKIGLNLQPGQRLTIGASLEAAPLARLVAEFAYERKCKLVDILWHDEELTLIRFKKAPRHSFKETSVWRTEALIKTIKEGGAILRIIGDNPDLLLGQDQKLIDMAQRAGNQQMAKYRKYSKKDRTNWCIVSAASPAWAAKVFPNLPVDKQVPALWDAIFAASRMDGNPLLIWQKHIKKILARAGYLNKKHYQSLHFNGPGTDLIVGLAEKHLWVGSSHKSSGKRKIDFIPNIPTEEIFTMPDRLKTNGVVTSSKPLCRAGTCLEKFTLTFKNGRVVDIKSERGKKILQNLINTDKGSARLGEVALVPQNSPIAQTGLLFYNTLFDENAATHLALGQAFYSNLENGLRLSEKSFTKAGGNSSLVHTDFMIGSAEMNVSGIKKDGTEEPVMKSGEWAF